MNRKSDSERLLKVVKENPTLDIVSLVSRDIANEDYGYMMADFGKVEVDEYCCVNERIYLKSTDYDEAKEDLYGHWDFGQDERIKDKTNEEIEELLEVEVVAYPWKKAIILFIEEM